MGDHVMKHINTHAPMQLQDTACILQKAVDICEKWKEYQNLTPTSKVLYTYKTLVHTIECLIENECGENCPLRDAFGEQTEVKKHIENVGPHWNKRSLAAFQHFVKGAEQYQQDWKLQLFWPQFTKDTPQARRVVAWKAKWQPRMETVAHNAPLRVNPPVLENVDSVTREKLVAKWLDDVYFQEPFYTSDKLNSSILFVLKSMVSKDRVIDQVVTFWCKQYFSRRESNPDLPEQTFWTRDDGDDQRTPVIQATTPDSNENQTAKLVEQRLAALRKLPPGQKKTKKNISSYVDVIDSEKDAVLTELNARLSEKRRIARFQAHYRRHCKKLQKRDQAKSSYFSPSYLDKRQVDQWLVDDEDKTDQNFAEDEENNVLLDMEIDDDNYDTPESESPGNAQDLMDSTEETLESINKHLGEPIIKTSTPNYNKNSPSTSGFLRQQQALPFRCSFCPKRFPSLFYLQRHIASYHCYPDSHQDPGNFFPLQQNFPVYHHQYSSVSASVCTCPVCGVFQPSPSALQQHLRFIHEIYQHYY